MIEHPLNIGIVGSGGIIRAVHMPGWAQVANAKITAVCDANLETARRFAQDFDIPKHRVFSDYRELVALEDLHAVDIATPNRFHTPAVLAALEHGRHVLCEKPLATSTSEVRQMAMAASKAGRLLMTGQHFRFDAMTQAIKRFVEADQLGEVYHARGHALRRNELPIALTFIDETLSGGGPCMDIGVHALDAALHLMGFPDPVRVSGTIRTNFAHGYEIPGGWGEWDRSRFNVEDFAAGFVHFSNGATLVLETSWLQHQTEGTDFSAHLYGKKASVHWPSGGYSSVLNGALIDGKIQPLLGMQAAHTEEILAFAQAIRQNLPSPVPVEQTLKVIAILEGIVESARLGCEVVLTPEIFEPVLERQAQ